VASHCWRTLGLSSAERSIRFKTFPCTSIEEAGVTDVSEVVEQFFSRRALLTTGATAAAAAMVGPGRADTAKPSAVTGSVAEVASGVTSGKFTTPDGAKIFYKELGTGRPVVFSHGWPLSADAWDIQMLFIQAHGFRCIAHDRRGHGRSSQSATGNDFDTYADDLLALIEALNLDDIILVGHSVGGGEVTRFLGRHGSNRVSKAVLISAIPPVMLKSPANPGGLPIEVFDATRASLAANPAQFYRDLGDGPFYGANRPGSTVSQGVKDAFWFMSLQAGILNAYESIRAFSETDFTEDLAKIDVPVLVLHGDDDQNVPIAGSALRSSKLIKTATLKVYPGAPHGLTVTHADRVNSDLLAFASA
jgi:non-heme chloroperoxidase